VRIEFEAAPPVDDPTPRDVDVGLRALTFPDNSFAILAVGSDVYIQAAMDDDGTFVVEYQDGSADDHYRTPAAVAIDDVVEAFQSYLQQDGTWRSRFEWQKVEVGAGAQAPAPPRRRRPARRGLARPRSTALGGWRSTGCLVVFYALLLPVAAAFTVTLLRNGLEGALASTGLAGEPGRVVVTACPQTSRFGGDCSGIFTPSDTPPALHSTVSIAGSYRAGDAVDVHVLDGEAWPEGGSAAVLWISNLLFGSLFVVGGVAGVVDIILRTWRRLRGSRAADPSAMTEPAPPSRRGRLRASR
jgi:hypothetical protein